MPAFNRLDFLSAGELRSRITTRAPTPAIDSGSVSSVRSRRATTWDVAASACSTVQASTIQGIVTIFERCEAALWPSRALTANPRRVRFVSSIVLRFEQADRPFWLRCEFSGRLAQLARAPARQAGGHRFEPCIAHSYLVKTYDDKRGCKIQESVRLSRKVKTWLAACPY